METNGNGNGNGQLVEYQDIQQAVINPMDAAPAIFRAGLDRRKENRNTLMEWIRSSLVEGRDFGSIMIKGQRSKPSLLKPGAEKIAGMLGLIPRFPNLKQYEDAVIEGKAISTIILKCELHNQIGEVIGEGVGARSVETQDNGDLNKALKMASKSALIDATLRCAGISEVFTQDLEEMPSQSDHIPNQNTTRTSYKTEKSKEASTKQIQAVQGILDNPDSLVYPSEKRRIHSLLEENLTSQSASDLISFYLGASEFKDGTWVKTDRGKLAERR